MHSLSLRVLPEHADRPALMVYCQWDKYTVVDVMQTLEKGGMGRKGKKLIHSIFFASETHRDQEFSAVANVTGGRQA